MRGNRLVVLPDRSDSIVPLLAIFYTLSNTTIALLASFFDKSSRTWDAGSFELREDGLEHFPGWLFRGRIVLLEEFNE